MLLPLIPAILLLGASHGSVKPAVVTMPAAPVSFAVHAAEYTHTAPASDFSSEEREFMDRINEDRTERGLYALTPDPLLGAVARGHCVDMCDHDYFSHYATTPGLHSPMDRYMTALRVSGLARPDELTVGENIYYCSASRGSVDVVLGHRAFMNSPEHRANILDPRFDRVGVGVWRSHKGQFWVTEVFLREGE